MDNFRIYRNIGCGILVSVSLAIANPLVFLSGNPPAASITYLIDEAFEGTGTPSGWTTTGTVNYDATSLMLGAQHMFLGSASAGGAFTISPAGSPMELYFVYRTLDATPGASMQICELTDSGDADGAEIWLTTGGLIRIQDTGDGTSSSNTVTALADSTNYHFWVRVTSGSGTNAVYTVAFSTDGIRPTSGNAFQQKTNGTLTTDVSRGFLGRPSQNIQARYDHVLVASGTIGDNP